MVSNDTHAYSQLCRHVFRRVCKPAIKPAHRSVYIQGATLEDSCAGMLWHASASTQMCSQNPYRSAPGRDAVPGCSAKAQCRDAVPGCRARMQWEITFVIFVIVFEELIKVRNLKEIEARLEPRS